MDKKACVYVVDDDKFILERMRLVLENAGFRCQTFEDAEQFLSDFHYSSPSCLLLDVKLPGLDGEMLQAELLRLKINLPIIFYSSFGTVPMAVRTLKSGAVDFLTKPVPDKLLLKSIEEAIKRDGQRKNELTKDLFSQNKLATLTTREHEIMLLAVAGVKNKEIAQKFNISYRTVENHRRKILKKTGMKNFFEIAMLNELKQKKS